MKIIVDEKTKCPFNRYNSYPECRHPEGDNECKINFSCPLEKESAEIIYDDRYIKCDINGATTC